MNLTELRSALSSLPHTAPSLFWDYRQDELIKRLTENDPIDFLTWPTIVSTMFVGDMPMIHAELAALKEADDWPRWERAIWEDDYGKPERLPGATWTSGNLVHQAYHLRGWEQKTGKRIDKLKSIIEIGGGYGAMAKVARRAGFAGKYVICDLPAFALLQQFYLSQLGLTVEHLTQPDGLRKADLLIALWSLDEMPLAQSRGWLNSIKATDYLVAMNGSYTLPAGLKITHAMELA